MKLIDKAAVVAEIENLLDKGRYHEEYDCAYRDGNNDALYALKNKIDALEVKEVDEEYNGKAMLHVLEKGVEQGKREILNNLWKSADGDDLPEIDREVIALVLKFGHYKVVFAHRVDENAEVHTSIDGKPLVLHPMRYDKGGWNQSDVKWWLDLELPNETDNGWLVLPDEEYQKQKEENG